MDNVIGVIMAAGKGTRMKTEKAKCVHKLYGKEMVKRVVEIARNAGINEIVTVVGHKREQVEELYNDLINGNIYHPEQIPNFYKIADPNAQEKENERCIKSNKDIKESQRYKNLVNNGVITYYSDEELKENAEIVRISKIEDCILLEFLRQTKKDEQGQIRLPGWYFIRIRLNGSSYTPCDTVFWRHFDNLQNYEPQKDKKTESGLTYKKQNTQV